MSKLEKYSGKVSIGLDIGIASSGISVVDIENGKILESIVRIFPEVNADDDKQNSTRRDKRGTRRLIRRRKTRVSDSNKLLSQIGFLKGSTPEEISDSSSEVLLEYQNPYELRVNGLTQQLSKGEIVAVINNIVKHRGISYALEDAEDEEASGDYKKSLNINQKLLANKTPGQIQFERLQKYNQVRGLIQINDENGDTLSLRNVFPNSAYAKELEAILQKQAEFYPELTDEVITKFLEIVQRKRPYYVGPGSEKSRTDYGIYKKDGRKLDNLFEELIGKDKVYPDEYRAAGNSFTAQYFNLLNDLNNIRVNTTEDGRLTFGQRTEIIEEILTTNKRVDMIKLIQKISGAPKEAIKGYRVDADGKPSFNTMSAYRSAKKAMEKAGIDVNQWPHDIATEENNDEDLVNFWDDLGPIITLNTENGEIRKQLKTNNKFKKYDFLTDELINAIIENKNAFKLTSNNKWHRMSLKTMRKIIPEMLVSGDEQMTVLTNMGLIKKNVTVYQPGDKINIKRINDEIYNPVVSRSIGQTFETVNRLLDKYENVAYFVIELPRDKNSKDEKKSIEDFQKKNKKEKDDALEEFANRLGKSREAVITLANKNKRLYEKIRYWYQQEGKDLYSGRVIEAGDLIANDLNFEIDHIIPISVSFDDGMNNKVLCYADMNQEKGQRTPKGLFDLGKGQGYKEMAAMIKSNKRLTKKKKEQLLSIIDLDDIETRKRFIARNLVDTRWASRVILNELQQYVKDCKLDTKVAVIRGSFTSRLRNHWGIFKTRDTYHHHAKDAAVIAVSPLLKLWNKKRSMIPEKVTDGSVNIEVDSETINDKQVQKLIYAPVFDGFSEQVKALDDKIKFKHEVDRKMNRRISKDTIYSIRPAKVGKDKKEKPYVIGRVNNIYSVDGFANFEKVYKKDKAKFLMYHIDPKTFEKLEEIYQAYPTTEEKVDNSGKVKKVKVSPFELYRRENGKVRRYAKKNNGPVINNLKYYDKTTNIFLDVTPKNAKNGKKVGLLSLNTWRVDVYYNANKQNYELMAIKFRDVKSDHGKYGILESRYNEIKKAEKVSENSEFMFSLFKRDRIKVIDENGKTGEFLFISKPDAGKNNVSLKPIVKAEYDYEEVTPYGFTKKSNHALIKVFAKKDWRVLKGNTDELGVTHYGLKEGRAPKNIIYGK